MLDELLKIKYLREDDAIKELAGAQKALEDKTTALAAKQRELSEYKTWRVSEENRLYEEIHKKHVVRDKVEELREQIGLLRQKDLLLEQEIAEAQQAVTEAEAALAAAEQKRLDAHKEVVKYEEYNQLVLEEERQELERREEVEMEDFLSGKPN